MKICNTPKIIILVLIITCISASLSAKPQDRQYTIFMILWRGITEAENGFIDYLSQKNINAKFVIRDCAEDKSKLSDITKEIRKTKPDLIYTFGTTVTANIAGTTENSNFGQFVTDVPIIFNVVANPVGSKLVPNLESSNRNLTGVSHLVPTKTQIKAMKSVIPFHKLGVIFNIKEQNSLLSVKELENLSNDEGFTLVKVPIPLDSNQEPEKELTRDIIKPFITAKVELVYLPSDSFVIANSVLLVELLNEYRIPTFSATEEPIHNANALMGIVSHYYNVGQFAGYKAEEILIDKKQPKDIPIETLGKFSFIINMKTAKRLRCYPPISILKLAEVITDQTPDLSAK